MPLARFCILLLVTSLCLVMMCPVGLLAAETTFPKYEQRTIRGWQLHIHPQLLADHAAATEVALRLLEEQLVEIIDKVPPPAVAQLREVPLWFSPVYVGTGPHAEYHPDAGWLKRHGRSEALAKCVEFTNVLIFEKERKRMPNFVLHELAHAYHDRVLDFDQKAILDAFERARSAKLYEEVERNDGRKVRHYALTNHKEYFAELSEAYFSRNDFFPFHAEQLRSYDPHMFDVLTQVWGVKDKTNQAR